MERGAGLESDASLILCETAFAHVQEFILDGEGTPSGRDCLIDRWRPLVATWILGNDPDDALTSNNSSLGYDR